MRVVDDSNTEVLRGEPGEIVVHGYNVMLGYINDPEETAAAIDADGWLRAGDIGTMDEDDYVEFTDRKKDVYIVGGFNAYPAEIENMILTHPKIAQVAVIGVPDDLMGEVGAAYVIRRTGEELTADEVLAWCRKNMANFKVPRYTGNRGVPAADPVGEGGDRTLRERFGKL